MDIEKKKVSAADLKLGCKLLLDIKNAAVSATNHIKQLSAKFEDGQMSTGKGISFLEVKNHTMLSYLANVAQLANLKCQGKSIKNDPTVERLVEIRTVLEKMRPIDQKIKYQIDKLLKTAATGIGENDPLRFKPNPGNLVSKLGNESGSEASEDEEGEDSSNVYKPPKLAAMHYDGDETEKDRLEKKKAKQMRQALSSNIMRELKQQYSDAPEEITDSVGEYKRTQNKSDKERQEYEEKYFVRKVLSKKEKHVMYTQNRKTGLEDITRFGGIGAITGDEDERPSKKRRLSSGKKSKGKKGSKKRKFRK